MIDMFRMITGSLCASTLENPAVTEPGHTRQSKIEDRIYVGQLMASIAGHASSGLTSFSNWVAVGFAAVLGLLISNIDNIESYIPSQSVSRISWLFLVAMIINMISRYLSIVISSGIAAAKETGALAPPTDTDLKYVLKELEDATYRPARVWVRSANLRILRGDFALGGRMNYKMAQILAWLVFCQMILVFLAIGVVAIALYD
jgi:hypothetical protein